MKHQNALSRAQLVSKTGGAKIAQSRLLATALLAAMMVASFSATPAAAQFARRGNGLAMGLQPETFKDQALSLRDIAAIIARETPGRVLDAQTVEQNGHLVYIVRWEPSEGNARGQVMIYTVDGETGRILSRRGG